MIDGEPGDLQFVVRTLPSARWERRGHDLLINETITLVDALTGGRWGGGTGRELGKGEGEKGEGRRGEGGGLLPPMELCCERCCVRC